jgi:hypothetical protein
MIARSYRIRQNRKPAPAFRCMNESCPGYTTTLSRVTASQSVSVVVGDGESRRDVRIQEAYQPDSTSEVSR